MSRKNLHNQVLNKKNIHGGNKTKKKISIIY